VRALLLAAATFAAGLLIGATLLGGVGRQEEAASVPTADGPAAAAARHPGGGGSDPSSARPVSSGEGEPTLMPGGTADGADVPTAASLRRWTLDLLDKGFAYYRRGEVKAVPADLRDVAAEAALEYARKSISDFYGGWLSSYEEKRRATGTLSDPPRIRIQARGSGKTSTYWGFRSDLRAKLSRAPLDLERPPHPDDVFEAYVEGGVQPLDKVLLLERIDLVYALGYEAMGGRVDGRLSIEIDGRDAFEQADRYTALRRGTLAGLQVLRPPSDLPDIAVTLFRGVVGLTAHGRYVSREEAQDLRDRSFRWVPEGDDGLLGSEPVTLQVLADHGGGNPRTVRLDGSTDRIDEVAVASLWDDTVVLRDLRDSTAWCRNTGVVPDGKVYRITRIDWRTRLDPERDGHSDFVIRFKYEKLVERKAPDGVEASGSWRGEIDVEPRRERDLEVVCSFFGMGEAVVYGELVDAPQR